MSTKKLLVLICTLVLLMPSVWASPTLDKIKKSGTIRLGVRDASIPFSYLGDKQQYVGYSIDLCMKAVESIKKKLALDTLEVKLIPVTSATRIPLTVNGTIDISCDSAINTVERQKQIAFTNTIFVVKNSFLSKKTAHLKTWMDLKGKTVVGTAGTINVQLLGKLNKEHQLGIKMLTAKDHSEAFLMVETGRADAFVMDDIVAASLLANAKNPNDYVQHSDKNPLGVFGLLLRHNDPQFKQVVDNAIIDVFRSGEINSMYAKWFQSPIPPKGIILNWPMSEQLKNAIRHPTDSSNIADYQ